VVPLLILLIPPLSSSLPPSSRNSGILLCLRSLCPACCGSAGGRHRSRSIHAPPAAQLSTRRAMCTPPSYRVGNRRTRLFPCRRARASPFSFSFCDRLYFPCSLSLFPRCSVCANRCGVRDDRRLIAGGGALPAITLLCDLSISPSPCLARVQEGGEIGDTTRSDRALSATALSPSLGVEQIGVTHPLRALPALCRGPLPARLADPLWSPRFPSLHCDFVGTLWCGRVFSRAVFLFFLFVEIDRFLLTRSVFLLRPCLIALCLVLCRGVDLAWVPSSCFCFPEGGRLLAAVLDFDAPPPRGGGWGLLACGADLMISRHLSASHTSSITHHTHTHIFFRPLLCMLTARPSSDAPPRLLFAPSPTGSRHQRDVWCPCEGQRSLSLLNYPLSPPCALIAPPYSLCSPLLSTRLRSLSAGWAASSSVCPPGRFLPALARARLCLPCHGRAPSLPPRQGMSLLC